MVARYITFNGLTRESKSSLEELFRTSKQPDISDLQGWEFRGWNISRLTRLLGIRKFKKGFYHSDTGLKQGELYGYNVVVRQNGLREPHIAKPNEAEPKHHGYFLVTPFLESPDDVYKHALLLDYGKGPNSSMFEPARILRDYLVQPDPNNPDIFLGKAYIALDRFRIKANFFVLERYNQIDL